MLWEEEEEEEEDLSKSHLEDAPNYMTLCSHQQLVANEFEIPHCDPGIRLVKYHLMVHRH